MSTKLLLVEKISYLVFSLIIISLEILLVNAGTFIDLERSIGSLASRLSDNGLVAQLKKISTALSGVQGTIYNAKFILSVGSDNVIIDPITGNYTFETTTTIEIKANLLPDKKLNEDVNIGTPFTRLYLKGKLVEPLKYSGELSSFISCEIINEGTWIKGKFYPELDLSSGIVDSFSISKALGSSISGYFEIDGDLAT